jgi:hypothetical protein
VESGKAQEQQEQLTTKRSGRRRKASKRLADYEVNVRGVECVQMSMREIDEALTRGELGALVRVEPDPERVQLAGLNAGTTAELEAVRRHETRLRRAFADVLQCSARS